MLINNTNNVNIYNAYQFLLNFVFKQFTKKCAIVLESKISITLNLNKFVLFINDSMIIN